MLNIRRFCDLFQNDDAADTAGPGSKSPEEKEYHVLKRLALNKLHLNMENVPVSLQGPFVDFYLKDLQTEIEENELLRISFNFVNEEVFRYNLNMAVRKLGFKSYFSRYNHGEGVAVFERV